MLATPIRQVLWARPEVWADVLVVGAWAVLLAPALADPAHLVGAGAHGHGAVDAVLHAAVMTVAMMVPLVLPMARYVAQSSLWGRRHRSVALFLAGFVLTWTPLSTSMTVAADAAAVWFGHAAVAVTTGAAAAVAHVAPGRRRRVVACRRLPVLAPTGRAADRDCVAAGVGAARACVVTCWALMAFSLASHGTAVMVAAFAVQLAERASRQPGRASLAVERTLLAVRASRSA